MHALTRLGSRLCQSIVGLLSAANLASAWAQSPPDFVIDFPAGLACPGFALRLEVRGAFPETRTFTDKNGNPVRSVQVGFGSALTMINMLNGNTIALRPNGSGSHTKFNADGTQTVSATGHNLIIMFPTDIPAGPTTVQYVGRVLYTVSADGSNMFTFRQVSGTRTDICAALA